MAVKNFLKSPAATKIPGAGGDHVSASRTSIDEPREHQFAHDMANQPARRVETRHEHLFARELSRGVASGEEIAPQRLEHGPLL